MKLDEKNSDEYHLVSSVYRHKAVWFHIKTIISQIKLWKMCVKLDRLILKYSEMFVMRS